MYKCAQLPLFTNWHFICYTNTLYFHEIKEFPVLIEQTRGRGCLFAAVNILMSRDTVNHGRPFPFTRLNSIPVTICKRQLLYMYLMSTRKSSNFLTIIGLEIIPSEKDAINFLQILFVYSRPITRKWFSVVNFPRKRR